MSVFNSKCPFCGSSAKLAFHHKKSRGDQYFREVGYIECRLCGAHGPTISSQKLDPRNEQLSEEGFAEMEKKAWLFFNGFEPAEQDKSNDGGQPELPF
jgi:hypothetical protein